VTPDRLVATALDWSRTAKETEKRDEGRALKNGATGDQAPERQDLFSLFDVAAALHLGRQALVYLPCSPELLISYGKIFFSHNILT